MSIAPCSVITVNVLKGGSGKTTICLNLAAAIARLGYEVAVIDIDGQRSLYNWHRDAGRVDFDCVSCDPVALFAEVEKLKGQGAEIILIDTPPRSDGSVKLAGAVTDLFIVPLAYELFANDAMAQTISLLTRIGKPAYVLMNNLPHAAHVKLRADAAAMADQLSLPHFYTGLTGFAVYENAVRDNMVVIEYEPNCLAAQEIEALCGEVLARLSRPAKSPKRQGAKTA